MRCRHVLFLVLGSCVLLSAGRARAQAPQGMGASTPLPLVVDLKKVPVGSWSEYRVSDGRSTMSIRMALVARAARSVNVETRIKGGPVAALGGSTVRMSLPLGGEGEVKPTEQVIQLGNNPPMLLPVNIGGAGAQVFRKLDPQKRISVDKVVVAGGTFERADHHQEKAPTGETIDFWTSAKILPFGLLKVASAAAGGGAAAGGAVTMELMAHGGGAKPEITKTPLPFDAAALMKQAQPAMGGAGDAAPAQGGPPLRPVPSPHPGMPPTAPGPKTAPVPKPATTTAPATAPATTPPSAPGSPPGGKNAKTPK